MVWPPTMFGDASEEIESPRLSELQEAIAAGKSGATDNFWQFVTKLGTPLWEPLPDSAEAEAMLVTFLWRGKPGQTYTNVSLYGEIGDTGNAWAVRYPLVRLANSDVWYHSVRMSGRARFSYSFIWPQDRDRDGDPGVVQVDGLAFERLTDPLNPLRFELLTFSRPEPIAISYAEGPDAPADSYTAIRGEVPSGQVETLKVASEVLGNRRQISIYTPPDMPAGCTNCNLLLFFDREAYQSAIPVPTLLDNLQSEAVIGPTVAVLIGNAGLSGRLTELPPNAALVAFVRDELLPLVRKRYAFSTDPSQAVVGGLSIGGLAAMNVAFNNPDLFGKVLSQSGSFWWWPEVDLATDPSGWLNAESGWMSRQFVAGGKLPLSFYLSVGTWEGSLMLLLTRTLRDILMSRGYPVTYREHVGGHDHAWWRSSLAEGLTALIGRK